MNLSTNNQSNSPSIYSDLQSLDSIRKQAQVDKRGAIKAAAKEFEAFFMNMMLKSMRQASEVIGEDSMFSSSQEKMFVGMLDEQMSVELSQKGDLGIAELMTRNLLGETHISSTNSRSSFNLSELPKVQKSIGYSDKSQKIEALSTTEQKDDPIINKPIEVLLTNNQKTENIQINPAEALETVSVGKVEKKSLFDNASSFINQLMPYAKKVAEKIGVDPKLLLAQAALETGWGKYIMHDQNGQPSHNLFGIKSNSNWKGSSVNIDTLEVEEGAVVKKKDEFRMYESFERSFADYVDFLQSNPRYQSALNVATDAKQFIESLQQAGYATDPNYAKKILTIFSTRISQE